MGKYFGTDGIRGTVGYGVITPDFIMKLGHAVGRVLRQQHEHPSVLIGKDTRISGYMLESALEAGFASAGVDVFLTGPLPTPGVAYLTRALRLALGVVISASHNPFADNGIKFFSATGEKLSDMWEASVEAALEMPPAWVDSNSLGRARRLTDAAGRYIEFCKSTCAPDLSLHGLRIVIDAAHGAAYQVAPAVLHELGADVISIGCQPDGLNINRDVGATSPESLIRSVRANRADFGIALDGDADRLQMVDHTGRLYNGDELLYIMVMDRLEQGELVPGAVGTLMTNMGIELAFKRAGVAFKRAKVGDRYVLEMLQQQKWLLGGESSGHLISLDKHTTGDALISALAILQAILRKKRGLRDWLQPVELLPQKLVNVRLHASSGSWQDNVSLKAEKVQIEQELAGRGRILIRPSGTEPLLRVMVEAPTQEQAAAYAGRLVNALNNQNIPS